MKTIGVLGGLGPQATMEFEQHVHRAAQRLIPARDNRGYPPMAVMYFREPPVVTDGSWRPRIPIQTNPKLLEAAAQLGRIADFLVITSNGVHTFQAELERAADRPILSMIDLALAEVRRRGWNRVGSLTLMGLPVYAARLEQRGLAVETIPAELQQPLDDAIMAVTEGRNADAEEGHGRRAVAELRSRGTDGIILGCTEIPILLRGERHAQDLLDPLPLLAEAAVRHALES